MKKGISAIIASLLLLTFAFAQTQETAKPACCKDKTTAQCQKDHGKACCKAEAQASAEAKPACCQGKAAGECKHSEGKACAKSTDGKPCCKAGEHKEEPKK